MTDARCTPPDGAEDGSWWWLESPKHRLQARRWKEPDTWMFATSAGLEAADLAKWGWRLASPHALPSPAELARLREIEEAAREERATNAAYDRAVVCGVPDYHERYQRFCAARDRLTAALAKEPAR